MPYVRAAVTDESYAAYLRVARQGGVSMAALIEAIGLRLIEDDVQQERIEHIVELARQVDADRRRRGHR